MNPLKDKLLCMFGKRLHATFRSKAPNGVSRLCRTQYFGRAAHNTLAHRQKKDVACSHPRPIASEQPLSPFVLRETQKLHSCKRALDLTL